jgi:DNA-binding response OmpR family regulator
LLRQRGYTVLTASTEEAAVAHAATSAIDLLLTDSVMPASSGRSVAEQVADRHRTCAVLYMSGTDNAVAPSDSFILKPFAPDDLFRKVSALLQL